MATTDSSISYEVYDISEPDALQKVDENNIEIVKENPDNVTSLGADLAKIAVFDDLLLLRDNEGNVKVEEI